MKFLKIIFLNLLICLSLFFLMGLLYFGIYGTGGYHNVKRILLVEIIYFSLGVFHVFILVKKLNGTKKELIFYSLILLLAYFFMAFIYGKW